MLRLGVVALGSSDVTGSKEVGSNKKHRYSWLLKQRKGQCVEGARVVGHDLCAHNLATLVDDEARQEPLIRDARSEAVDDIRHRMQLHLDHIWRCFFVLGVGPEQQVVRRSWGAAQPHEGQLELGVDLQKRGVVRGLAADRSRIHPQAVDLHGDTFRALGQGGGCGNDVPGSAAEEARANHLHLSLVTMEQPQLDQTVAKMLLCLILVVGAAVNLAINGPTKHRAVVLHTQHLVSGPFVHRSWLSSAFCTNFAA